MTNIKPPRGFIRVTKYKSFAMSLVRISSITQIWPHEDLPNSPAILIYGPGGEDYDSVRESVEEITKMIDDDGAVTTELADAKKLISDLICENQGLKHKIDMVNAAGSTYKGPDPGGIIDGMIKQQQLKATGSVIWGTDPGGRIDYLTKHQTKETGE